MTTPRLPHWQRQHEDCFISIRRGLPKDLKSAHLSDQEGRQDLGQEYHRGKTQLHPTGTGDVLATVLVDALTQYPLEDLPDTYRADTGALIQDDRSAYNNVPVCRPRREDVG